MINLSRVVLSGHLNVQTLNVYRSTGSFVAGRWTESTLTLSEVPGIVYPSTQKELQQVPEGDRVRGAITFLTAEKLYVTRTESPSGVSDKIEWNGELYKILSILPWMDYGYYASVGERIVGD